MKRSVWFGSYINTILQREIRDIANIEGLADIPKLLTLLAARVSGQLNTSEVSRSAAISYTTLKRYLTILRAAFLIDLIFPYHANIGKRIVKSPKIIFTDSGLLSYLLGYRTSRDVSKSYLKGALLENFIIMEIKKQITWSKVQPDIYHYRNVRGNEVDIILEKGVEKIIGIEVKSGSTIDRSDFKGLNILFGQLGKRFLKGIVLYSGQNFLRFGKNLYAVPVDYLWRVH